MKIFRVVFIVLALLILPAAAEEESCGCGVERRRDQFLEDFGYMVMPIPYKLPGIGEGIAHYGGLNNISKTYVDFDFYVLTGDVEGSAFEFEDIHLLSKRLILDARFNDFSKVQIKYYGIRGMNGGDKNYRYVSVTDIHGRDFTLTATALERRLNFYLQSNYSSSVLDTISDSDGKQIAEFHDQEMDESSHQRFGFLFDYTDDRQDPRKGVRFDISRQNSPPKEDGDPNYYTVDYNLTGYVPVGKISTWAFNFFRSDAIVEDEGDTDYNKLASDLGMECMSIEDPAERAACEEAEREVVETFIAANKNGTASPLGGDKRLRSYSMERYKGAHSMLLGTELRWNLTAENTPFDIWVMRDIRTGIQLAFFYEQGTVAEEAEDLGDEWRASYGPGARLITASGAVYRVDWANGDEGAELTMMIEYPW